MVKSEPENSTEERRWWRLPLGDAIQASPLLQTVLEAFTENWQAAGNPAGMSLWLRTESDGLHCQQTLYFSPGCQTLAERFEATACTPPSTKALLCLAGSTQLNEP